MYVSLRFLYIQSVFKQDLSSRYPCAAVNDINIYPCTHIFNRVMWIYTAAASNIFWGLYKVSRCTKMAGDDLPAIKVNNAMFLCPVHGDIS